MINDFITSKERINQGFNMQVIESAGPVNKRFDLVLTSDKRFSVLKVGNKKMTELFSSATYESALQFFNQKLHLN